VYGYVIFLIQITSLLLSSVYGLCLFARIRELQRAPRRWMFVVRTWRSVAAGGEHTSAASSDERHVPLCFLVPFAFWICRHQRD